MHRPARRLPHPLLKITLLVGVSVSIAAGLYACSSSSSPPAQGDLRQDCYPNGTCNAGLTCVSNVCVELDGSVADTSSGVDASDGSVAADTAPPVDGGGDAIEEPAPSCAPGSPVTVVLPDAAVCGYTRAFPCGLDASPSPSCLFFLSACPHFCDSAFLDCRLVECAPGDASVDVNQPLTVLCETNGISHCP
jgi:hypothetical protein